MYASLSMQKKIGVSGNSVSRISCGATLLPPSEKQANPLFPGYNFNINLVAGLTPINKGESFDFFIDRQKGMDGYIINLTIRGRGIVHDGTRAMACEPGDLLLFPPGVPHYYGRDPNHAEWHHRWIYFHPRAYWKEWLCWPQKIDRVGHLFLREPALQTEFELLFKDIESAHRRGTRMSENLSTNLLERLLLRSAEEHMLDSGQQADSRVTRVCHVISEHLFESRSIAQLASDIFLSPSRLEHLFRQQMGMSISRWQEDQRLIRAQQLLKVTESPISVIAASVGYDDQLYFSRVFRKRIGVSPSIFRKQTQAISV